MNANGERDFSEIELRHAELRKMVYQEFKGASTMTINILLAEGITSKEEARVHIEQKKKIFGLGKVGMQKLCALLGIQGGERKQKLPLTAASIPRAIALLESHGYTVNPPAPATPEYPQLQLIAAVAGAPLVLVRDSARTAECALEGWPR